MIKKKYYTALAWLVALLLPLCASAEGLRDLSGNSHTLEEFAGKGKWLVVMVWASDCQVCNAEAEKYQAFYEAHREKDATLLGVSMDGAAKEDEARAFIARHGVQFPNLIGEPGDVASLFMDLTGMLWRGTPSFLFYSPDGTLTAQQVGAVPPDLIEDFIHKNSQ